MKQDCVDWLSLRQNCWLDFHPAARYQGNRLTQVSCFSLTPGYVEEGGETSMLLKLFIFLCILPSEWWGWWTLTVDWMWLPCRYLLNERENGWICLPEVCLHHTPFHMYLPAWLPKEAVMERVRNVALGPGMWRTFALPQGCKNSFRTMESSTSSPPPTQSDPLEAFPRRTLEAGDMAVLILYFLFVLAVGLWVSQVRGRGWLKVLQYVELYFLFFIFYFWPHCMACGFLDPQPGITPMPRAVKVWSPNCWTTREVLRVKVFKSDRIGIRIRGPGRVR